MNKDLGMDNDKSKFYKNFIFRKRQKILNTDNFTNWFTDKNNGNQNESGDLGDNTPCLSRKNQSYHDENDIHSQAEILQYLLLPPMMLPR